MKRNILFISAITAIAALVFGTLSVAANNRHSSQPTVIHVTELYTGTTHIAVQKLLQSKSSANNGDYKVFQDPLTDPNTAKRVGTVFGVCFATDVKHSITICPGLTFVVNGEGTFTSSGAMGVPGTAATFGIYGGTGKFAGATGKLTLSFRNNSYANWVATLGS